MKSTLAIAAALLLTQSSEAFQPRYHIRQKRLSRNHPLSFSSKSVKSSETSYSVNVLDYGANGDGSTDNTQAFKSALEAVAGEGGGYVDIPAGHYNILGQIHIPTGVYMRGTDNIVESHQWGNIDTQSGTVILANYGREETDPSKSFITVNADSGVHSLSILYPAQKCESTEPVAYPPTIYMQGKNGAVTDVELLNSWIGVNATGSHRHYIARVQGQPIMVGVYIDETYDIGRIEDVHFNPWYCSNTVYMKPQTLFGRSFVFGRSDWEYVFNTFSFAYAIGYDFIQTSTGKMNGNFLGLGADLSLNASVRVQASQAAGLLITNGEFTSFKSDQFAPYSTADPTQVLIEKSNTGAVIFEGTSFWGPTDSIVRAYGSGTLTMNSCVFVQWDLAYKKGSPALLIDGGSAIINGNTFLQSGKQIEVSSQVKKAIIMGNALTGKKDFDVQINSDRYADVANIADE